MTTHRCRHAFETVCVHANGDVVCSILDGRGDFVLGNVHQSSLPDIFHGARYRQLQELVLSEDDSYCRAIGKHCPLKSVPVEPGERVDTGTIRFLQIEPTTACDLRCLTCPVRDFDRTIGWRDAYRAGGSRFFLWDSTRRAKQAAADAVRRLAPRLRRREAWQLSRTAALLLRGRIPRSRNGTLSFETTARVINEAGPSIERVDFYNFGEPFLYRHLVESLRHIRRVMPHATIGISTDGMPVRGPVEDTIVGERLLDWLIFSIDGADPDSYRRYRIRGDFDRAFASLARVHGKATGTGLHVMWQYVVFNWNDSDAQLGGAIDLARNHGIPLWFDFARSTWGRSRRRPEDLQFVVPFLKPETSLPDW